MLPPMFMMRAGRSLCNFRILSQVLPAQVEATWPLKCSAYRVTASGNQNIFQLISRAGGYRRPLLMFRSLTL